MVCFTIVASVPILPIEVKMTRGFTQWLDNTPLTNPVERRQATVFQWVLILWLILTSLLNLLIFVAPPPTNAAPTSAPLPPIFLVMILLLQLAGILLCVAPVTALVLLRRG